MEEIVALRMYETIIGIVGILGNGLVCLVIGKVPAMQTRTNAFIFHQAVVDFLGSSLILLQSNIPLPALLPDNAMGWILCYLWRSKNVMFLVFVTSTLNLLAVTMERYLAIVHPFKYQLAFARYPRLKVCAVIAACWVLGIANLSYKMTIYEIQDRQCVSIPGSGAALAILIATLQFVIPVIVMLIAYIRTGAELKRGAARVGPDVAGGPGGQAAGGMAESLLRARRNTFKTLLVVFIVFLVCWMPNQLLFFLFNLGFPIKLDDWYVLITVAMVATNSCVNPVIYAFKYRQFRKGLRKILCSKRRIGHHLDVDSTTLATLNGPQTG